MLSHSRKSKKGFIPDPEPLPEQLRQALANTGRGHHSSTTTIPLPSSPSNTSQKSIQNIQSHIGNMSLKNFSQENFNQSISNQRNPNSPIQLLGSPQTTQITVQDQMHSLTSSRSSNQTPASGRGRSSSSSIVSRNTMTSRSGSRFDMHVRSQVCITFRLFMNKYSLFLVN
jgi:DNA mismatch repair ATPase MutL